MAAEIFDGSLQFTAGIDTGDTEKQIQELEQQLTDILKVTSAANKSIVEMAEEANAAFDTTGLEKYSTEVDNLFKSVQSYLQGTFGTEKLQALDAALNAVTDEGEQLKILLQFFKDNADALSLNPEGAQQMLQNIEALEAAMEQLQDPSGVTVILPPETVQVLENVEATIEQIEQTAPAAGQAIQNGIITPLGELTTLYNELDAQASALEKQLETETDPVALKKINQELGKLYEQLDVVQAKYEAFNNPKFGKIPEAPGRIDLKTADADQLKSKLIELDQYAQKLRQALTLATEPEQAEAFNSELASTRTRIEEINARFEEMNRKQVKASAQLQQIRNELATMSPNDAGYQELLDKAVQIENSLKNVNKTVTLLGSNTAGIQALKQGFNGLLGGVSAVVSAYSLFSDNTDQLQQTMLKLFAVMQIVGGAEQFLATVNKNSAVVQYLLAQYRRLTATATEEQAAASVVAAGAEAAQAAATEGAAAAQLELNAAMAANPIGAILIAITAVVGAISLYVANTESATEAQTKLNEALAATNELLVQLAQLQGTSGQDRVRAAESLVSLAQAEGKSNQEVLDLKVKANNVAREEAIKQLAFLDVDKQRLGVMEAQLESLNRQKAGIESIPESARTKEQKQQLENLTAQEKSIKSIYDYAVGINRSFQEGNAQQQQLAAEQAKLAKDNALKSATSAVEARAIAAKKGTQAEYLAQIDAINARRHAELQDVNLTAGERVKINAQADRDIYDLRKQLRLRDLDDEIALAKAVLASSQSGTIEAFNARLSIIQLEAKKELEQEGITAAKKKQIQAEATKEINDLNRQYNFQASEAEINQAIAVINNRLAVVQKGTGDEYELRRQLLDQQEALEIAKATSQIDNEQRLADRTKEIHAKSLVDRKKLDDQYADQWLDRQLRLFKAETDAINTPLEKTLRNPDATATEKYQAQRSILVNQAKTLENMWLLASNKARAATGDTQKAAAEAAKYKKELDETNNAIDNLDTQNVKDTYQRIGNALQQIGGEIIGLGNSIKSYNADLGELVAGLGGLLSQTNNILKAFDKSTSKVDNIAAGIQGVVNLVGLVINAAAERARVETEFNQGLIDQQLQYNLALNEAIRLNSKLKDNVFLVNYQGQLRDGINALTDAQNKYQDALKALATGQAIAGQRNAISGSAILSGVGTGAAAGAAIGSIVPVIGTAVGAVVGAVVGGIVGLFGGKKKKDSYVALLQEYPELVRKTDDGVLEINKDLAQTLINNKLVSDATKVLIQDTLDWQEAIDKANQQIRDIISDLAGDLGSNLRDSLVEAFEQGTDSAMAFAKSVERTLDNVLSQMIFNNVFGSAFDKLQKEMQDSFKPNGDMNWQDDLQSFFEQYGSLTNQFNEQLEQAQKAAEQVGLEIFQNPNAADSTNTLKGAIKGMTEQQAELLAGQFGGVRLNGIQQLQVATQNLTVLNQIKGDTAYLVSIESRLRKIETVGIKIIK